MKRFKRIMKRAASIFIAVEGWVDVVALSGAGATAFAIGQPILGIGFFLWAGAELVSKMWASYASWKLS